MQHAAKHRRFSEDVYRRDRTACPRTILTPPADGPQAGTLVLLHIGVHRPRSTRITTFCRTTDREPDHDAAIANDPGRVSLLGGNAVGESIGHPSSTNDSPQRDVQTTANQPSPHRRTSPAARPVPRWTRVRARIVASSSSPAPYMRSRSRAHPYDPGPPPATNYCHHARIPLPGAMQPTSVARIARSRPHTPAVPGDVPR